MSTPEHDPGSGPTASPPGIGGSPDPALGPPEPDAVPGGTAYADAERVRRRRQVGKLAQAFVRACRGWRLYTERHELRQRFVSDLHAQLAAYLDEEHHLLLEVTPERLLWEGEVVHDEADDPHGLPFLLHRDGVRLVRFLRGIDAGEVRELVAIFAQHLDGSGRTEADVSAQIWEAHLPHFEASVASVFVSVGERERRAVHELEDEVAAFVAAIQGDDSHQDAAEPEPDRSTAEDDGPDPGGGGGLALATGPGVGPWGGLEGTPDDEGEGDELAWRDVPAGPPLTRHELVRLRQQIEEVATGGASFDAVGAVLYQVAREESNASELKACLEDLRATVLPLFAAGAFREIVAVLKRFSLWIETTPDPEERPARLVRGLLASLSAPRVLSLTVPHLATLAEEERGDLFAFVTLLPRECDSSVFWLLSQAASFEARRVICDALVVRADFDPEPFKHRVLDDSWRLVSDMVYCLGRIGSAEAVQYMLAALQRDDSTVRSEVLEALRAFRSPRIDELTRRALGDPSEKVRISALRYLAFHRVRDAAADIQERVLARGFSDRSLAEKRAFCIAWVHVARSAALPWLASALSRHVQDAGDDGEGGDDPALPYIAGLGAAPGPESDAALKAALPRLQGEARAACRDALKRA
ncbi:HEAT repeat domain-containing protein [Myxococcota bacterium]|nr:HEAT repeat domain-containing protein [Myxococcota bacterium]